MRTIAPSQRSRHFGRCRLSRGRTLPSHAETVVSDLIVCRISWSQSAAESQAHYLSARQNVPNRDAGEEASEARALTSSRSSSVYQKPNTTHMAYRLRYPEYGVGIREQVVHASARSQATCAASCLLYHP
eukprot:scaffold114715_cov63-Phaeocystis_antarctica.AAC.5